MAEAQSLVSFLAELPEHKAAEARLVAAQIDALEAKIGPPGWIERTLIVLGLLSVFLFLVGIGGLLGILAWVRALFGLGGILLMISAFPGLIFAYLLSVRGRTRADDKKMELNKAHFLPHGGIYFGGGKVVRVDWNPTEKTLRDHVQMRYDAATKRW